MLSYSSSCAEDINNILPLLQTYHSFLALGHALLMITNSSSCQMLFNLINDASYYFKGFLSDIVKNLEVSFHQYADGTSNLTICASSQMPLKTGISLNYFN